MTRWRTASSAYMVGTPVHYAAASGAITSLMDRVCYAGGKYLQFKPAACIASCRRGGASATYDQINKYFGILNMPIVSSNYWNMVHGNTPDEVRRDEEGMQTMRQLGEFMKAKNKIITAVLLSAGAAVGTALINKYIKMSAVARNLLTQPEPRCYRWRLGNICYTKVPSPTS